MKDNGFTDWQDELEAEREANLRDEEEVRREARYRHELLGTYPPNENESH